MKNTATINIGIIEDEYLVMESLQILFGENPTFSVTRAAGSVEEFLASPFSKTIDILLLDIGLPGMSGLQGIRIIKERLPKVDIIMLTTFEESDKIFKALCAGATSYLTKRTPLTKIVEAVLTVHRGGSYMSPSIARKVVEHFSPKKTRPSEKLTGRQLQVTDGIVEGLSYKMIADKYQMSINTVRDHIRNIYRKLEINSRTELIKKSLDGEL